MLALSLLVGCAPEDCDVHAIALDLAGPGAADCGIVAYGDDRTALDECVADAFAGGQPFVAQWQPGVGDSVGYTALASDGATVWVLGYDSDPSGGSRIGAVVDQWVCENPQPGTSYDAMPIACDVGSCICTTRVCGREARDHGNDCC